MMRDGSGYTGPGRRSGQEPTGFSREWRVPENERIFYGVSKTGWHPPLVCECHGEEDEHLCGYDYIWEHCDQIERGAKDITDKLPLIRMEDFAEDEQTPVMFRRKRQTVDYNDPNWEGPINIDDNYEPENATWGPTWTEAQAEQFCTEYLTTKFDSAKKCLENVPALNISNDLAGCIEDIQIIDNTTWAKSALNALKDSCLDELNHDMAYANGSGAAIKDDILASHCTDECNMEVGRGTCQNSTCICVMPWGGADCSIDTQEAPVVGFLHNYGRCDLRSSSSQNCTSTMVYGENFMEDANLTCHMERVEVNTTGTYLTGERYSSPGEFISTTQVGCDAQQPNTKYLVGVSNDASRYEERLLFNVFDSACHECDTFNTNPTCTRKNNKLHCLIEELCFAAGEIHPVDPCYHCYPDNSTDGWTERPGDVEGCAKGIVGTPPGGPSTAALIVIIIASILIALLLIGALVYRFVFKKKVKKWEAEFVVNEDPEQKKGWGGANKSMSMYRDKQNFSMFEGDHLSASGSYRSSSSGNSNEGYEGEASTRALVSTTSRPGINSATFASTSTKSADQPTVIPVNQGRAAPTAVKSETPITKDLVDLSQPTAGPSSRM